MKKPQMPLRGDAHRVSVVRAGQPPEVCLGRELPGAAEEDAEAQREARAAQAGRRVAPRASALNSVHLPLPVREQSALFYRVPAEVQRELVGQATASPQPRREASQRIRQVPVISVEENLEGES